MAANTDEPDVVNEEVPEKFKCSICANILCMPEKWLKRNKTCPHCQRNNFQHIIDQSIKCELNDCELKIYCANQGNGCEAIIS